MPLDFPSSPTIGQTYTSGTKTWEWDGSAWVGKTGFGPQGTTGTQGTQGIQGNQGTTGLQGLTGLQGTQGAQGTQGLLGLQGITGTAGVDPRPVALMLGGM